MTKELSALLVCNINTLQLINDHSADRAWIDECTKTLQYVLDNEAVLEDPSFPVNDLYLTFHLLHDWIVKENYGAYIELSQKYKPVVTPEQAGVAFKKIIERMKSMKY